MILVVGGAGYIGSHACKALRLWGLPHVAFDSLEKGHQEAVHGTELVRGDLRNPADVEAVFSRYPIETVMHFGAYIEVGESVRLPEKYWTNNFIAVKGLLDTMLRHQCYEFIFSSTAAVFGEPESVPLAESARKAPLNPYGASKLAVEMLANDYQAYGLNTVIFRYFNATGADPDGQLGEDHRPETHLIPLVLDSILGRRPAITIYGDDYPTSDGTCVRDYVHIVDLVEAHLKAISYMKAAPGCHDFNLGNGKGFSVREVIDACERVTGKKVPVETGPRRPGDSPTLVASSEKARRHLSWSPRYEELETMIEHAYRWRKDHPEGYDTRPGSA